MLLTVVFGSVVAAASPTPAPSSRAAELAMMLVKADMQADRRQRVQTLEVLRRVGAHPLMPEDAALLVRWTIVAKRPQENWRGRTLGPGFRHGTLAPGEELVLEQIFSGGVVAAAAVAGTPDGGLRLRIVAPDRSAVCDHSRQCNWQPRFTGRYRLSLSNHGTRANRYFLVLD